MVILNGIGTVFFTNGALLIRFFLPPPIPGNRTTSSSSPESPMSSKSIKFSGQPETLLVWIVSTSARVSSASYKTGQLRNAGVKLRSGPRCSLICSKLSSSKNWLPLTSEVFKMKVGFLFSYNFFGGNMYRFSQN